MALKTSKNKYTIKINFNQGQGETNFLLKWLTVIDSSLHHLMGSELSRGVGRKKKHSMT